MKTIKFILLLLCIGALVEAQTVYITKTGSKYHQSGCRYLSRSQIPISLQNAKQQGFGPCSVCKPPTTVRSTPEEKTANKTNQSTSKTREAQITSVVDGTDILEVNLWHHRTIRTTIITSCRNKEKVTILDEDDKYVKLRTAHGEEGWCMRMFLK